MIYHVLPGDAQVEDFRTTGIEGEVIVFRECLIVGPLEGETYDEFWSIRGKFIFSEYGEDEIEFHDKVVSEIETLSEVTANDTVYLWFEYELFCSANMWFCLSALANSNAAVYRISPSILDEKNIWRGYGGMGPAELQACFDEPVKFSEQDLKIGSQLWQAFRERDAVTLRELSKYESVCFPLLERVGEAAAEVDTRPSEILAEIKFEGKSDFGEIFSEFSKRAGEYGFGDLQIQRLLDRLDQ